MKRLILLLAVLVASFLAVDTAQAARPYYRGYPRGAYYGGYYGGGYYAPRARAYRYYNAPYYGRPYYGGYGPYRNYYRGGYYAPAPFVGRGVGAYNVY